MVKNPLLELEMKICSSFGYSQELWNSHLLSQIQAGKKDRKVVFYSRCNKNSKTVIYPDSWPGFGKQKITCLLMFQVDFKIYLPNENLTGQVNFCIFFLKRKKYEKNIIKPNSGVYILEEVWIFPKYFTIAIKKNLAWERELWKNPRPLPIIYIIDIRFGSSG